MTNVIRLPVTRKDIQTLVDAIKAEVYVRGVGFALAEVVGALEIVKYDIIKEQE